MKILSALIVTCALLITTSPANAVEFNIVGNQSFTGNIGDIVTIDIVLTNASGPPIAVLGASVYNYGANQFVSGRAVSSYFNIFCIGPVTCFGGFQNQVGPNLVESSIRDNGNRVQFATSATTGVVEGSGVGVDRGLDGTVGTAMFSLSFEVRESAFILIGTGYEGDGFLPSDGSANYDGSLSQAPAVGFEVIVLPEPGTAVLTGLGLAALSGTRRKSEKM